MDNLEESQISELLFGSSRSCQDEREIENLLNLISSDSSSSSSEESECEAHPKCKNYVAIIDSFSDEDFKCHMRLQRPTVEYLIATFSHSEFLPKLTNGGRLKIGSKTTIYLYIWYISNTVTFRQLGNLFGVSKSSAWVAVRRVTSWLISIGHNYVKWPQGAAAEETCKNFEQKQKIPNVIGAIDCTHISIKAPKVSKEDYFDRKQNYSLVLQAVVDANKKFIDITCGEPGSLHDSRVLRRSDLYRRTESNYDELFHGGKFLLGDSAYPATSWLVPPFKDYGNLTESQRKFNYIHSSTRMIVENAFGLLKGRFRRLLKFTEQTDLRTLTNIIVSACVLHNICIMKDDLFNETIADPLEEILNNDSPQEIIGAVDRRDLLFTDLLEKNII